jgi:hypothetical protein
MSLKSFNFQSLNKYFGAQSAADLNIFLEKLPQHTSQSVLTAAAVAWIAVAGMGLFLTIKTQELTEIRSSLMEAEALTPIVPVIRDAPVSSEELQVFVEQLSKIYKGLEIKQQGPSITVNATTINAYTEFREAIGHIQNGGTGWRVSVEKFCVGLECDPNPIQAELRINRVSIEKQSVDKDKTTKKKTDKKGDKKDSKK